MKKSLAFTFLLFSHFSPASLCQEQFAGNQESIRNVEELGAAMTSGLKIKEGQEILFHIYLNTFFPEPFRTREGIERVFEILENYPELSKPSFREQTVSSQSRRYQKTKELSVFVNNFTKANAGMRVPLIRSGEQIPFWSKALNPLVIQRPDTKEQKEALRQSTKNRLSELFAGINLDTKNWEPVDIITLYQNLQKEKERQMDRGEDSSVISKAMLDLIHTAGFSNRHWLDQLKHKDPFIVIQTLKQIIDYRESLSLELRFKSFNDLKESLEVQGINKKFYDREQLLAEIDSLEAQIENTRFFEEEVHYRVRALSLEESPFRGCMGGDCSSSTYFEKGLDPNFIYWTKTDQFNKSSGQITTVLGQAKTPGGEEMKVAFVDKIHNLSVEELIPFLLAVKKSLSEEGYRLALPLQVGDYIAGLSNESSISVYIADHILPQLETENKILRQFSPHPHEYNFNMGYSRAYDSLDSIEFHWSLPENLAIKSGARYEPYILENLNGETFIQNILNLRESNETMNLIVFINNVMALRKVNLESLSDPDIKIYLKGLLKRVDLNLKVKKRILYELISLRRSAFDLQEFFEIFDLFFTDSEKQSIIGEMSNWNNTNSAAKRDFFRVLNIVFNLNRPEMAVFNNLFKNKGKEDITGDDFFFAINQNSLELVKYLLNHNSDLVNIRSEHGITTLHFARDESIAELLLERNPNLIDMQNKNGETALHMAARDGSEKLVNLLLKYHSTLVNIQNNYGDTALHMAVREGKESIVSLLLKYAPDLIDIQNKYGYTALHFAVGKGKESIVSLLLKYHSTLVNIQNNYGDTALHLAVREGKESIVSLLLKHHSNLVNIQNNYGDTALHMAVREGKESIVSLLLKHHSNLVNIQNKDGDTALHMAVREGKESIVNLLLKHHSNLVNIQNKDGDTALHLAVREGKESIVSLLLILTRGPDFVNIQNKDGNTALHVAVGKGRGYGYIVQLLLKRAPDLIDIKNKYGDTALHLAARGGKENMINLLLEHNPNLIDIKNKNGDTVLHLTVGREGKESLINLLLERNPNLINIKNNYGDTALHLAVRKGMEFAPNSEMESIVNLLLERNPNLIDIKNNYGDTALHEAVEWGHKNMVKLLLKHDPDLATKNRNGKTALHIAIKNRNGKTALHIAIKRGFEKIVQLLRNY